MAESPHTDGPQQTRPKRIGLRAVAGELAARTLCAAGVPTFNRRRRARKLAILMFHGVEGMPIDPPCGYVTDAATLRRQLEYLREHFIVLPLDEALERLQSGTLPDRAAALTFDDGTRNLATHAGPILRDLQMPASVFVATGPMGTAEALWPDRLYLGFARTQVAEIDLTEVGLGVCSLREDADRVRVRDVVIECFKRISDEERIARVESLVAELGPELDASEGPFEMLTWDDARSLASDGLVAIYPHSVSHPILSRCSDEKVDREVSESCRTVERETGRKPEIFAYPNGGPDDFDERTREALHRNGVQWSMATVHGFADRDSDPLAVPRIGIGSNLSFAMFQLKTSGFVRPRPRLRVGAPSSSVRPGVSV